MRVFLIIMLVLGTGIPLALFANYFLAFGVSVPHIIASLFPNPLAAGFTADILISILVFLVWTFFDMDRRRWVILLLASCMIGLSASLPLYLLFRLKRN